jgi:hypothetical protein
LVVGIVSCGRSFRERGKFLGGGGMIVGGAGLYKT